MTPPSARALLAAATREDLLEDADMLEQVDALDAGLYPERLLRAAALLRSIVALGDHANALNRKWLGLVSGGEADWGVNDDGDLTWGRDAEPETVWSALASLLPEPEEPA